jgi:hypothetical protein
VPTINAPVYWSVAQNKGVVDKIHVAKANGATVIQWSCGTDVASFAISGLASSEFNPTASQGQVTSFSTTDSNNTVGEFTYTVSATKTTGETSSHDPKIENDP